MIYDNKKWYMNDGYLYNPEYGMLHRYIYTKYNGLIPEGHIVHHKNGDKLDNVLENLIAMTKSEHNRLHHKGRICSKETKSKLSKAAKGRKYSDKTKEKISQIHKGKPKSDEHKRKLSEAHKGKIISDETKLKMSEAHKARSSYI